MKRQKGTSVNKADFLSWAKQFKGLDSWSCVCLFHSLAQKLKSGREEVPISQLLTIFGA